MQWKIIDNPKDYKITKKKKKVKEADIFFGDKLTIIDIKELQRA